MNQKGQKLHENITLGEGIFYKSHPKEISSSNNEKCKYFGFDSDDSSSDYDIIIERSIAKAKEQTPVVDKNVLAEKRKELKRFLTNPEPEQPKSKKFKKNKRIAEKPIPDNIFANPNIAQIDIRTVVTAHNQKNVENTVEQMLSNAPETNSDERNPTPPLFEEIETVS